jgi:hypothetical protein
VNQWPVRSWLLQQPKPVKVRLTDSEGEVREIEAGKRPAIRTAESICAIDPVLIEAIGPNGELLRAFRPHGDGNAISDAAPAVPPILATDPHAALLSHFANLVHRAYEHSTEVAFEKIVQIVERMEQRSENIEKRLERAEAAYRRPVRPRRRGRSQRRIARADHERSF